MTQSLEKVLLLPPQMSPLTAMDLSLCLTGDTRATSLVRYLALSLLYLSWHFDCEMGLEAYFSGLTEFIDDDGPELLDSLAHPPAYTRRGLASNASPLKIKQAIASAESWAMALTRPGLQPLKMQSRAIEMLLAVSDLELEHPDAIGDNGKQILESLHRIVARSALDFPDAQQAQEFLDQKIREHGGSEIRQPPKVPPMAGKLHQVFNPEEARTTYDQLSLAAEDSGSTYQRRLASTMAQSSGIKAVAEVPTDTPLAELYSRFPHFEKPLDYISKALALAACGEDGNPVYLPPILLKGGPGTGKTFFAQELSRVLGTIFIERDISVTSEAFVLTGLDAGWKGAKPGLVFNALVNGPTANPLICLNEIDKAQSGENRSSPIAPLYALLEPTSARTFTDEFLAIPLDASKISWVLTCNEGYIPPPILSRLEAFEIAAPTPAQCRVIAQSVWTNICSRQLPKGHGFPAQLKAELLDCVSTVTPRIMRKALVNAAGSAAMENRKELSVSTLTQEMGKYAALGKSRSIGFGASL